jgi:NRAMP (natural resistance-associated macrophage protein)-like metal ion transporter
LGPGVITGASDDDPSGIVTYLMAGASFGYSMLWTALISFPLMAGIQLICAKIGLVQGCGLAAVMRRHYPRYFLYAVVSSLIVANTINAGADIAAIAAGVNLLVPVPVFYLVLPISIVILVVQMWGSYRLISNIFKWLTLSLFAYIGSALLAGPDWSLVLRGTFFPTLRLDGPFLAMLVAILGTTISPYLFFWQANHEAEEKIAQNGNQRLPRGTTDGAVAYAAWDVNIGMFLSNIVMYFIIFAGAATLGQTGQSEITNVEQAALALRPVAGDAAFVLMALGLIGTGFLAVPILTASAAYAVAEVFNWKCGLDERPGRAKEFYMVIVASTAVALVINYLPIDPMQALFYTAVINGLLSPPLLVVIMLIANNRAIMARRVNGPILNTLGWITTAIMAAAAIFLVHSWLEALAA